MFDLYDFLYYTIANRQRVLKRVTKDLFKLLEEWNDHFGLKKKPTGQN